MGNGKYQNQMFSPIQMVLVCFIFVAIIISIAIFKKIWFWLKYRKKYFIFPKLSNKGIAYVAMSISIAIVSVLLLVFLSAGILAVFFRAYPGWRITIEGILIKIGGLLFGPIIGIFIGIITDLLTIVLSAGSFHYGYFIVAGMYGLIGGLIQVTWNHYKKDNFSFVAATTAIYIVVLSLIACYITFQPVNSFSITLFNFAFTLNKIILISMQIGIFSLGMIVLWLCLLIYNKYSLKIFGYDLKLYFKYHISPKNYKTKPKGNKNRQKFYEQQLIWYSNYAIILNKEIAQIKELKTLKMQKEENKWFNNFAPILGLIIISEPIIETVILPCFDVDFSTYSFDYWIALRTVNLLWLIPFNLLIIFGIYQIISPIVNYDHKKNDLYENFSVALNKNA